MVIIISAVCGPLWLAFVLVDRNIWVNCVRMFVVFFFFLFSQFFFPLRHNFLRRWIGFYFSLKSWFDLLIGTHKLKTHLFNFCVSSFAIRHLRAFVESQEHAYIKILHTWLDLAALTHPVITLWTKNNVQKIF